jgi:hypothetical protein
LAFLDTNPACAHSSLVANLDMGCTALAGIPIKSGTIIHLPLSLCLAGQRFVDARALSTQVNPPILLLSFLSFGWIFKSLQITSHSLLSSLF